MADSGKATPPKGNGQRGGGKKPIDSKTRARVRKLAREGKHSRNAIAKLVGISTASVTKICAEARPPISFDRSGVKAAVEARQIDLKAKRADLSTKAVTEVERLFRLLTSPHEVIHWDKDGMMHRATIERPTSGDVKNYATSIGILIDKHLVLVRTDSDDRDLPAVDAWLQAMMGQTA